MLFEGSIGSITGVFSAVNAPVFNGQTLGVFYSANQVTLQVVDAALQAGDYNGNGTVDAADYVLWRKGVGTTYTQNDYTIWRTHFGQTAGSGAALPTANPLSAVPEPAILTMVLTALLLSMMCRRFGL